MSRSPGATGRGARDRPPARRRLGVPLTVVEPAPVLDMSTATGSTSTCPASDGPGRAARAPPGRQRRGRRCGARRARARPGSRPSRAGARRAGYASRALAGAAGAPRRSTAATSCSTGPTTRPAPPRWRSPSTTCGRSSSAGRADARRGLDGRQGRGRRHRRAVARRGRARRPRRRDAGRRPPSAAGRVALAARWRATAPADHGRRRAGPGRGHRPRARDGRWAGGRRRVALPRRLARPGRLVDDPLLRDPIDPA